MLEDFLLRGLLQQVARHVRTAGKPGKGKYNTAKLLGGPHIEHYHQAIAVIVAETFEQVRVNFQEMFTELFGGGKANLVLADESDPLESGIEIIARPPGQQLHQPWAARAMSLGVAHDGQGADDQQLRK